MANERTESINENLAILSKNIYGNWVQQVTYVFAELDIAEILINDDLTAFEIAQKLNLKLEYFEAFLRCAVELNYVEYYSETQKFHLNDLGKLLSESSPYSKKSEARLNGSYYRYMPWGNLDKIIKNGHSTKYSPTLKDGTLSYLSDKPELLSVFHNAMLKIWKVENEDLVKAIDFSEFKTVMDIGCGTGSFLKTIIEKEESIRGIMFDFEGTFDACGIEMKNPRLEKMYGDFFVEIPDIADLYIMKNVIHNWPEEKSIRILQNVHKAMCSQNSINTDINQKRLLIIENVLPENGSHKANWMNLNFMILTNGSERTENEYRSIGKKCGFDLTRVLKTETDRDILEFSIIQ